MDSNIRLNARNFEVQAPFSSGVSEDDFNRASKVLKGVGEIVRDTKKEAKDAVDTFFAAAKTESEMVLRLSEVEVPPDDCVIDERNCPKTRPGGARARTGWPRLGATSVTCWVIRYRGSANLFSRVCVYTFYFFYFFFKTEIKLYY